MTPTIYCPASNMTEPATPHRRDDRRPENAMVFGGIHERSFGLKIREIRASRLKCAICMVPDQ